uniref:NGF domain-containing protein n=1 Tax=Steinernema glaseri TaxID=37863 RepID=A0A1I7YJ11_9BILA
MGNDDQNKRVDLRFLISDPFPSSRRCFQRDRWLAERVKDAISGDGVPKCDPPLLARPDPRIDFTLQRIVRDDKVRQRRTGLKIPELLHRRRRSAAVPHRSERRKHLQPLRHGRTGQAKCQRHEASAGARARLQHEDPPELPTHPRTRKTVPRWKSSRTPSDHSVPLSSSAKTTNVANATESTACYSPRSASRCMSSDRPEYDLPAAAVRSRSVWSRCPSLASAGCAGST